MAIHIDLLVLMGRVSQNMFTNPQTANAPGVPFNPLQIGGYQYQPNGNWQSSKWDGVAWVPNTGDYAAGDLRTTLDGARADLLARTAAQQAAFEQALNATMPLLFPISQPPAISPTLGTTPDPLVKTIRYVDPLILDLDGDGLEITPLSAGILFDANGDTIKTGTAWAGADDGMLVWDRNANGLIDSGAELFGDETLLTNGQKAAHGFAALADLDKGSVVNGVTVGAGDGVFDAKDAQYAHLRIWRDVNQDGISQAAELKTLAETVVASITLGSTATGTNYGDAILAQSGTFTRADGSSGQAGSFILAQNSFVRAFTPITVSAAATALPDLGGSGWVRDLQEAATLSPELIGLFNQAKDAPTRAGYVDAMAALLREWGNDSAYASASKQALSAGYGLVLRDPVDAQEAGWMDKAIKASEADRNAYRASLSVTDLAKFDAMPLLTHGRTIRYKYSSCLRHILLGYSEKSNRNCYQSTRRVSPAILKRLYAADLQGKTDGRINRQDAIYNPLRAWRDADQYGISQATELQTLQSLEIASIGVQGKSKSHVFNSCLRCISLDFRPKLRKKHGRLVRRGYASYPEYVQLRKQLRIDFQEDTCY